MTHSNRPEEAALSRKTPTEALPLSPAERREGRRHEKYTRTLAEELAAGLNKAVLAEEADRLAEEMSAALNKAVLAEEAEYPSRGAKE